MAAPTYSVTTYSDAGCSLNPSTTTTSLVACSYQYVYPIPLYPNSYNSGYYYVTTQCASGPTAAPTGAPSNPTANPTPIPTAVPTPLAQATGYVLQYAYSTSTCTGVPNSITSYSLGVCFPYITYYAMYTSSSNSSRTTSINFLFTIYYNTLCTSKASSIPYSLPTACSRGIIYTYSSSIPVVPQSVASRYCL